MHREVIDGTIPMRSGGGMKHLLFFGWDFHRESRVESDGTIFASEVVPRPMNFMYLFQNDSACLSTGSLLFFNITKSPSCHKTVT